MKEAKTQIYQETADIETASEEYASRFDGPIGEWMLKVQEDIVLDTVSKLQVETILDVGGGHGQLADPLSRAGYSVTVIGSDQICANRIQALVEQGQLDFETGDLVHLPYEDKQFDLVLCFRFVSHCQRWKQLISELCRVASRHVIIDYPTWQSVNIASPLLFKLKRNIEKNTRTYTLFSHRQIKTEFIENDFSVTKRENQFALPMALHRALKKTSLSEFAETTCRTLGLTRILGSPSILLASDSDIETDALGSSAEKSK